MENCCQTNSNYKKGFWTGLLFGLIPHVFCIAFIILSVIGATGATVFVSKFLLIPHLFLFLVIASLSFATLSAFIYLKKVDCCTLAKIKSKWKYLSILYGSVLVTNLIVIFVIFPLTTNLQPKPVNATAVNGVYCPLHPPKLTY